ncbi:MAG: transcription termination factor Rho [Catonella sp.]|uniref:transcription termination factor Rho n=1 Tax=Catonella sp. TaxID=2382125 RepID=UPI003FA0D178
MDYKTMKIVELRAEAKERGVKSVTTLNKSELVEILEKLDKQDERSEKATEVKTLYTEKASPARVENGVQYASKPQMRQPAHIQPASRMYSQSNNVQQNPMQIQNPGQQSNSRPIRSLTSEEVKQNMIAAVNAITSNKEMALSIQQQFLALGTNGDIAGLDSGEIKSGILEVMPEGFGFVRCDNYLPGENDVYVSPAHIRRFNLKTGDIIVGNTRVKSNNEKFAAILYIRTVNGKYIKESLERPKFEDLTPIFPNRRIRLESKEHNAISMRMVDLIAPIGKGQRGMIVSQPKAGKTTLLKQIARSITDNNPEMHLILLLIDERPEEVTDMKDSITGEKVEIIYSTFDEAPENHKRVAEMVIERAKRLVEYKKDVIILLDSITRLARAYNLTVAPSGRTLSGGLDPAALHMPKRFFGAARNMREGGSLTILATALVDTGSRMDDVVFEEFKGTGNMELVLDRGLSEKRIFPAIDLAKSSTRRDDLLFTPSEVEANDIIKRTLSSRNVEDGVESIINIFKNFETNEEAVNYINKQYGDKKLIR